MPWCVLYKDDCNELQITRTLPTGLWLPFTQNRCWDWWIQGKRLTLASLQAASDVRPWAYAVFSNVCVCAVPMLQLDVGAIYNEPSEWVHEITPKVHVTCNLNLFNHFQDTVSWGSGCCSVTPTTSLPGSKGTWRSACLSWQLETNHRWV